MTKFVVLSDNYLTELDQEKNTAVNLWKDENTLAVSTQYVLRMNKENEANFRPYIKYTADQIATARTSLSPLKELKDSPKLSEAFASNYLATGELLHKRVHGSSAFIPKGTTVEILQEITYNQAKFQGATIANTNIGDYLNFSVLDTDLNFYSKAQVDIYGPNLKLNQFGFNVYMTSDSFKETSEYAGDLYAGMFISCLYTNNTANDKTVYMNSSLHEVINE